MELLRLYFFFGSPLFIYLVENIILYSTVVESYCSPGPIDTLDILISGLGPIDVEIMQSTIGVWQCR